MGNPSVCLAFLWIHGPGIYRNYGVICKKALKFTSHRNRTYQIEMDCSFAHFLIHGLYDFELFGSSATVLGRHVGCCYACRFLH